jgi:hypothetical protein
MSVNMLQVREVEDTAEQKLWRAVIASTVEEGAAARSAKSVLRNSSCLATIRTIEPFAIRRESTLKICEDVWKKFARVRSLKRKHSLCAISFRGCKLSSPLSSPVI